MQRMTDVLSRMLNDPATRAALSGGGEDSLEGVIDQQENSQRGNDNNAASNPDARSNRERQQIETETETETDNDVRQAQENVSSHDQSEDPNNDETRNEAGTNSVSSNDDQVSCDLAIQSSSLSTNNFNTAEPINNDLVDDVQVTETQTNPLESNNTSNNSPETRSSDGECDTEGESSNTETNCRTDMASKREENMMENLQDRLTTMRDGFLER